LACPLSRPGDHSSQKSDTPLDSKNKEESICTESSLGPVPPTVAQNWMFCTELKRHVACSGTIFFLLFRSCRNPGASSTTALPLALRDQIKRALGEWVPELRNRLPPLRHSVPGEAPVLSRHERTGASLRDHYIRAAVNRS